MSRDLEFVGSVFKRWVRGMSVELEVGCLHCIDIGVLAKMMHGLVGNDFGVLNRCVFSLKFILIHMIPF